jgi:hypothetical protein
MKRYTTKEPACDGQLLCGRQASHREKIEYKALAVRFPDGAVQRTPQPAGELQIARLAPLNSKGQL